MDVDRPVDTHPQSAEQRPLYCCYWGEKAVVQTKKVSQIDRMYSAYAQPFVMLWELTHDPTLCHNCEVIKLMCANVQICMTCQKHCMFRGKTTCCVLLSGLCILRVFFVFRLTNSVCSQQVPKYHRAPALFFCETSYVTEEVVQADSVFAEMRLVCKTLLENASFFFQCLCLQKYDSFVSEWQLCVQNRYADGA